MAILIALAGCDLGGLREVSFPDRCARMMTEAYPGGGGIAVTGQTTALDKNAVTTPTMVVTVRGTRAAVPSGGFVVQDVAVECRFENGVLTSFRWTAGPFR
jgi:hypothetical protein